MSSLERRRIRKSSSLYPLAPIFVPSWITLLSRKTRNYCFCTSFPDFSELDAKVSSEYSHSTGVGTKGLSLTSLAISRSGGRSIQFQDLIWSLISDAWRPNTSRKKLSTAVVRNKHMERLENNEACWLSCKNIESVDLIAPGSSRL
jgi:hypothetical protein